MKTVIFEWKMRLYLAIFNHRKKSILRVAKFICKAKLQLFQTTFTILVVMGIAQIIDGV